MPSTTTCGSEPFHDPSFARVSDSLQRCQLDLTWDMGGCAVTEFVRVDPDGDAEVTFTLDEPLGCWSSMRGFPLGDLVFDVGEEKHTVQIRVPTWVAARRGCASGPLVFDVVDDVQKPETADTGSATP